MKKIFEKQKPSEWIEDVVCSSGTPVQECGHCGRVNYNASGEYMDEGELEELEAKTQKNPDDFHPQGGEIRWGFVTGIATVIGCPCNFLTYWENIIWLERRNISQYLNKRASAQMKSAQEDHELSEVAAKSVE